MTSRGVFFLVFVSISAGCELGAGVAESGVGSLNGVDSLLVAPAVGNMRSDVESWLDSSSSSSCSSSSASESFLINLFLFEGIVSMIYSSNWLIGKKKKKEKRAKRASWISWKQLVASQSHLIRCSLLSITFIQKRTCFVVVQVCIYKISKLL